MAPTPQSGTDAGGGASRRRLVIGAIAAVVVIVLGGSIAAAWNFLAGSDDALAAHVPADAAMYLHVNLDPTVENKLGIRSLAERLDAASDEDLSVDALMAQLQEALGETGVDGIDAQQAWDAFGGQAAMWLGPDAFDAAMGGGEMPQIGLLLTLDDADTIADMLDAEAQGEWRDRNGDTGWMLDDDGVATIRDDILHIGTADAVNASLTVEQSLADDPDYEELNGEVPAGVLSMWFDADSLMDIEEFQVLRATDAPAQVAMSLSFSNSRMVVATAQRGDADLPEPVGEVQLGDLPSGGLVYARVPQLGARMTALMDTLAAAADLEGAPFDTAAVDQALESVGTSLDELAGWMGDLTFAVGYDPTSDEENAFMELHLGTGDEQATQDLLDRALAELPTDPDAGLVVEDGRLRAGDLTVQVADGTLQIVTTPEDGVLGISENGRFTEAIAGLEGDAVLFVDVRGIAQVIAEFVDDEDLADLQVLGAIDAIAATQGDPRAAVVRSDFVISWDSPWDPLVADDGDGEPALPDVTIGTTSLADAMGSGFDLLGTGLDPVPEPLAPDDTFGDDPELDELWDQCADGDMAACDQLWLRSGIGSGYEDFAETCGGAGPRDTTCELDHGDGASAPTEPTDLPTSAPTPVDVAPPGTDPELDVLWRGCAQGDMEDCDTLYWQADLGSDYEDFGATCGNRIDTPATCVGLFPED